MPPKAHPVGTLIARVIVYILLAAGSVMVLPSILLFFGYLFAATIGTFFAAAIANAICVRIYEHGNLADLGLAWTGGSLRNIGLGLAAGVVGAALVTLAPTAAGLARFVPDPGQASGPATALYVFVLLVFGAVGEELLFRGYAFQLLTSRTGALAAVLLTSLLFAAAHLDNKNVSWLGLTNTAGFGLVLGYAMLRAGDLWLPIGIHVGWNWMLPLAGVSLSGFTMGLTGYSMRWNVGELWSGGNYGPEASILTSAVIVGLLVYVHKAPVARHAPLLLRSEPET